MDVLRGDRVSLRELDADNRSLFADRFVGDYDAFTMLWGLPPHPSAKAAARDFVSRDDSASFAVHDLQSGDHVGIVQLHHIDLLQRSAFIIISLLPTKRGHGYATEAVQLACSYGFDHLGLHRMCYGAFATNTASLALAARCGFVEEGRYRKANRTRDGWVDEVRHGMLDTEWARLKSTK